MVSLRLVEEDARGIPKKQHWLRPEEPNVLSDTIACTSFDLGFPTIVEAVSAVTEGSGVVDLTRFHGASTVSVDLTLLGPEKVVIYDELRSMCHPSKRCYLYVNRPEWDGERRIRLRANAFSFVSDRQAAGRWKVSMSWVNPSGRMEAAKLSSAVVLAGTDNDGGGIPVDPTDPGLVGQGYGSLTYGSGLYGSRPAPSGG